MSSHHIVRENQEPALLVASWDALDHEHLGQLLEWSPTVITDVQHVDHLLAWGIKVDVVFGGGTDDFIQDSIKQKQIISVFMEDALCYLIAERFKAVNILADTVPTNLTVFASKINIVLFCHGRRYAFVKGYFEKWNPKGEYMYLDEACIKSFQGLEYIDKGIFRTVSDGFITLEFNTDSFVLVGEDVQ
ncbi:MAG TPA: thiamine diphosphokinase [Sphingobacterium sp.]|nr:thiamine diphosphokinase [Sphingobacterium sp.]